MTPPHAGIVRLTEHLVGGAPAAGSLGTELSAWLAESSRFRAFAETYRDKIRKKVRTATSPEALRDVRAELRAAHLLLEDRRIELAFEAYGSGRGGPDFTVTRRGERPVNLEVTRLRRPPDPVAFSGLLVAKLHQLPPSVANALLVAVEASAADTANVDIAIRSLRAKADTKDEPFFAARGFTGSRAFYDRFLRLGAVLVWCEDASGDRRAALWTNRSARIGLPAAVARAFVACLRAR
jgi:hypothetical protein